MADLVPFWSPGVGALVGGGFSLVGSYIASKRPETLAAKDRRRREERECRSGVSNLLAELQANLRVLKHYDTLHRNTLVSFSADVWNSNKAVIATVSRETEQLVQTGYAELAMANAIVPHSIQRYGDQYALDSYKGHVEIARDLLQEAIAGIESWLEQATSGSSDE